MIWRGNKRSGTILNIFWMYRKISTKDEVRIAGDQAKFTAQAVPKTKDKYSAIWILMQDKAGSRGTR